PPTHPGAPHFPAGAPAVTVAEHTDRLTWQRNAAMHAIAEVDHAGDRVELVEWVVRPRERYVIYARPGFPARIRAHLDGLAAEDHCVFRERDGLRGAAGAAAEQFGRGGDRLFGQDHIG